jgi:hypothetical protein
VTNANMICELEVFVKCKSRDRTARSHAEGRTITYKYGVGINCLIRNLEGHGACLEIESPAGIPNVFTLTRQDYQHGV